MVSAASKGLGFGIAQELARNGATVCIASRTENEIEAAAEKLRNETGATIHSMVADVSSPEAVHNWISEIKN